MRMEIRILRRITILLVVLCSVFIFTSCQQETSITGKWRTAAGNCIEFTEEGKWYGVAKDGTEPFDFGDYTFDGKLLTFYTDSESEVCKDQTGKYKVDISDVGKITFKLIEDECSGRGEDLSQSPFGKCEP